jgi:lactoylglutathione lyase
VSRDDTDAECERIVERAGCDVLEGPVTIDAADAHVAFLEGPDGYVLELVVDLD